MNNNLASWREVCSKKYVSSLTLVCLAVLLHAADSTLVATLVPAIVDEVGGVHLIPWAVSLYEIGSIVAGAASGLLALNYGLKKPMLVAALMFSCGCSISAIAPQMWVVLCGRVLQGLGGGGLIALSFVAVSILFPKRLVPSSLAAVSMVWGTSAFLGPLIGGLFEEYTSWRYAFWFFSILAMSLACWILIKVPDISPAEETENKQFPVFRLMLLSVGVILIAFAGAQISLVKTPVFVALGVICLACFLTIDSKHQKSRLLPRNPITLSNPVGSGLTMILCFTISTIAITVYGPYFLTKIHGTSVLIAGYIVACSSVGWSAAAITCSGVDEKHDRKMIMLGMMTLTISIIGFVISVPKGPIWLIAVFAFIEGIGFGMAYSFILRVATSFATKAERERVSAAIPTVQRSGYAIGAAFIGIVANAAGLGADSNTQNYAVTAFWVFASCLPIALIGLVAAFKFVRYQ